MSERREDKISIKGKSAREAFRATATKSDGLPTPKCQSVREKMDDLFKRSKSVEVKENDDDLDVDELITAAELDQVLQDAFQPARERREHERQQQLAIEMENRINRRHEDARARDGNKISCKSCGLAALLIVLAVVVVIVAIYTFVHFI